MEGEKYILNLKHKEKLKEIAAIIGAVYKQGHLTTTTLSQLTKYSDLEILAAEAYYCISTGYSFPSSVWGLSEEDRLAIWGIYVTGVNKSPSKLTYTIQHMLETKYEETPKIIINDKIIPNWIITLYERVHESVNRKEEDPHIIKEIEKAKNTPAPSFYLSFLDDLILSLKPKKRQRLKGMDRLRKAYTYFLYNVQMQLIETEILDISTSVLVKVIQVVRGGHKDRVGLSIKNNRGCCDYCAQLEQKDFGFGSGFIPWFQVPTMSTFNLQ